MTNAERVKLIIAQAQLEAAASAIAAEIKAVREEGRRVGMMEAARIAWAHRERWKNAGGFHNFASAAMTIADAIESRAKEAGR